MKKMYTEPSIKWAITETEEMIAASIAVNADEENQIQDGNKILSRSFDVWGADEEEE